MQPIRNRTNRITVILVVVIAVVFAAVFAVWTVKNRQESAELARMEAALRESLDAENSKTAELESDMERELTPEEKIALARKRYGLVFPNEILFLPED